MVIHSYWAKLKDGKVFFCETTFNSNIFFISRFHILAFKGFTLEAKKYNFFTFLTSKRFYTNLFLWFWPTAPHKEIVNVLRHSEKHVVKYPFTMKYSISSWFVVVMLRKPGSLRYGIVRSAFVFRSLQSGILTSHSQLQLIWLQSVAGMEIMLLYGHECLTW